MHASICYYCMKYWPLFMLVLLGGTTLVAIGIHMLFKGVTFDEAFQRVRHGYIPVCLWVILAIVMVRTVWNRKNRGFFVRTHLVVVMDKYDRMRAFVDQYERHMIRDGLAQSEEFHGRTPRAD